MSKLEELVPPLELCKLIPKGEFEDCAFCWIDKGHACILPTDRIYPEAMPFIELRRYTVQGDDIPAPTLQEIMANIPYCRVYKKTANFYVAVKEKDRVVSFNGATAALKLWLKLKGVDYEK